MSMRTFFSGLLQHVKRWKDTYEVLGILLAVATSAIAVRQTATSLAIQRDEFHLRNRPYVVLLKPHFAGSGVSTDRVVFPRTVVVEMQNISDIPATKIKTIANLVVDGTNIFGTVYPSTALTSADPKLLQIYMSEEQYALATATNHLFRIECFTFYSGILGEPSSQYETTTIFEYYPQDGTIRPEDIRFR